MWCVCMCVYVSSGVGYVHACVCVCVCVCDRCVHVHGLLCYQITPVTNRPTRYETRHGYYYLVARGTWGTRRTKWTLWIG